MSVRREADQMYKESHRHKSHTFHDKAFSGQLKRFLLGHSEVRDGQDSSPNNSKHL